MDKRQRELRRLAAEFGCTVEATGGQHYRIVRPDGTTVAVASRSASDFRSLRNLLGDLRRKGR